MEAGCEALRADGIKVRVVSAPSEGLFRGQSKEYQESVLPKNAKIFGMTAGLPVTLQGLVGANGKVWGMEASVSQLLTRYLMRSSVTQARTFTSR